MDTSDRFWLVPMVATQAGRNGAPKGSTVAAETSEFYLDALGRRVEISAAPPEASAANTETPVKGPAATVSSPDAGEASGVLEMSFDDMMAAASKIQAQRYALTAHVCAAAGCALR